MTYLIENTHQPGSYIHRAEVPTGESSRDWPDEDQAKARCEKANAEAEALGIEARYEVRGP